MISTAAIVNRRDLSEFAERVYCCSGYQRNNPELQTAAKLSDRDTDRLRRPQDASYVLLARNPREALGNRCKNWISHFRRNMDLSTYRRIVHGFSTPSLVDVDAVFHALTEPFRGTLPEEMRYNVQLQMPNKLVLDKEDVRDETVAKRTFFLGLATNPDEDSYKDPLCLHIALSYRHEHPDERARKGYAHRQRVSEQTYKDIAANITTIASKANMAGVRIWTDQHYATRRASEDWIEEALIPFAMYQVYYHNQPTAAGQGDETRAWLFAEHTFAMSGFGLCSNVSELPGSWKMHEPKDSLAVGMGRMQIVDGLLRTVAARIQCYIGELAAYNAEDLDFIKRWSLSVSLYSGFYSEKRLQGREPVDGMEWIALVSVARHMNPVDITMNNPTPGCVYSCKEQRVVVSEKTYRSWNGIREFSGGFCYDTKTDKNSYVSGRLTLEMQMRATRLGSEENENSNTVRYLIALVATSGHGYNFVEATVEETGAPEGHCGHVLEWRRLSELEVVRRRLELLKDMRVPLDDPERSEVQRRWRCMDLPSCEKNLLGVRINWF